MRSAVGSPSVDGNRPRYGTERSARRGDVRTLNGHECGLVRRGVTATLDNAVVVQEAARRRTFAIISHPDAGKTTLTEKLLLYAGAVGEAGSVTARRGRRAAT